METLLEITYNLFLPELHSAENVDVFEAKLAELQGELKSNLKLSQSLLIKCTEMLKSISGSLGLIKVCIYNVFYHFIILLSKLFEIIFF